MAKAKKKRNTTYSANCAVCVYMKKHEDFKLAVMNSSYFNYRGTEDAVAVCARYATPFTVKAFYLHAARHQKKDMEARRMRREILKQSGLPAPNIQGVPVDVLLKPVETGHHIESLDKFIVAGDEKLRRGEMPINAATYLQAIKIKADVEKSNKDRGVDIMKMFKGADGIKQPEGA